LCATKKKDCNGFDYFKSSWSRTWPDLETQIWPELHFLWIIEQFMPDETKDINMLTAAIKRQYN